MLEACHLSPSVSPHTVFPAHLQLLSLFLSLHCPPSLLFHSYSLSWPFCLCLSLWQNNSFRDHKASWVSAPLKFYWDPDALFRHLTKFRVKSCFTWMEKNIIYHNDSNACSFLMIRRPLLHSTTLHWFIYRTFSDSIFIKRTRINISQKF